jgi:hypothetical protein
MRRGFVIQLHSEGDPSRGRFAGRVEHVDSGRSDSFNCAEDLVRFVEQTMLQIEETARQEKEALPPER